MGNVCKGSAGSTRPASAGLYDLLSAMPDCVFVLDAGWRFVFANEPAIEELGAGGLIGTVIWNTFPESVGSDFELCYRRAVKTKAAQTFEAFYPPLDAWYEVRAVPLDRRLVVFFRNITQRRTVAARLDDERSRLVALATNDAIFDRDLETDRVEWSGAIERLVGERPGPDVAWWADRVHPEDVERVRGRLERFVGSGGERWQDEYRLRRRDGSYAHVLDRGFVIRDGGRARRMVGAISDLTEHAQARARIAELQAELIQALRVSAANNLAAALAHELNQPLAASSAFLGAAKHLMEGDARPAGELAREALAKAAGQILRAGEIIRRLRRMIERREIELKAVALRPLIGEALLLASPKEDLAEVSVSMRVPTEIQVLADPVQLQQVLLNLYRNALEAMAGRPIRELAVSATVEGGEAIVRVADSGPGVPREQRDKLFTSFSTTKDTGLGVGLSISRAIVEAHGGRMWLEDRSCGGAVFCFSLRTA